MAENPEHIDGFDPEQASVKKTKSNEALQKTSLTETLKANFADLKQKILPELSDRSEQTSQPKQISRREALTTLGKGVGIASLAMATGMGVKDVLASEKNHYYNHSVSDELHKLYAYRVDPIHQRPADYVQTILKDMTEEKNESSREYQSEILKKHFEREKDDPHVMDSDVLHIEGNDHNFVTHSRQNNGDVEIRVYYYPDANNREIEGKLLISPNSYTRRYNGITEIVENPGSMKEEIMNLRELLLGEHPAITEAKEMIENLSMDSDMVQIAKTLSRISESSIKQDLGWKLVKKGKDLLKNQIPDIHSSFSDYGNNEFVFRFYLPQWTKWIGVFVNNGNITIENNDKVTNVSLQIITDVLAA